MQRFELTVSMSGVDLDMILVSSRQRDHFRNAERMCCAVCAPPGRSLKHPWKVEVNVCWNDFRLTRRTYRVAGYLLERSMRVPEKNRCPKSHTSIHPDANTLDMFRMHIRPLPCGWDRSTIRQPLSSTSPNKARNRIEHDRNCERRITVTTSRSVSLIGRVYSPRWIFRIVCKAYIMHTHQHVP